MFKKNRKKLTQTINNTDINWNLFLNFSSILNENTLIFKECRSKYKQENNKHVFNIFLKLDPSFKKKKR